MVAWYDIARESWERFGDDGPSIVGYEMVMLRSGSLVTFHGVYKRDERFFELRSKHDPDRVSIVERTQWWAHMAPADLPVFLEARPHLRWEHATE